MLPNKYEICFYRWQERNPVKWDNQEELTDLHHEVQRKLAQFYLNAPARRSRGRRIESLASQVEAVSIILEGKLLVIGLLRDTIDISFSTFL